MESGYEGLQITPSKGNHEVRQQNSVEDETIVKSRAQENGNPSEYTVRCELHD